MQEVLAKRSYCKVTRSTNMPYRYHLLRREETWLGFKRNNILRNLTCIKIHSQAQKTFSLKHNLKKMTVHFLCHQPQTFDVLHNTDKTVLNFSCDNYTAVESMMLIHFILKLTMIVKLNPVLQEHQGRNQDPEKLNNRLLKDSIKKMN